MNLLDENIPESQRVRLRRWRIPMRQIGVEVGRKGMTDEEILALLPRSGRTTFFTRDADFYRRDLCHARRCLAWLDVTAVQAAEYVRRLLRDRQFNTQVKRMGTVMRLSPSGISLWKLRADEEMHLPWSGGRRR